MHIRSGTVLLLSLVVTLTMGAVTASAGTSETVLFARRNSVDSDLHRSPYLRWETDMGGASFSEPGLSDHLVVVGTDGGSLIAFDARTGSETWRYNVEPKSRIRMTPLVHNDTVLFGTADGTLYALDGGSGALKWKVAVSGWVTGSPVVSGLTTYVGCYQGKVHAIGADGKEVWSSGTGGEFINAPLVLTPYGLVVGSMAGSIMTLDCRDGSLLWKKTTDGCISGIAYDAARDSLVATSVGPKVGGIYMLKASSGEQVWRYRSPSNNYWSAPSLSQDYAVAGNLGELACVDLNDGSSKWTIAAQSARVRVNGVWRTFYPNIKTPVVAQNLIFAVTSFEVSAPSRMLCVTPAGELVNSWVLPLEPASSAVASADGLYLATSSGVMQAWSDVRLNIAGKAVVFSDAPPLLVDGYSLVPVRSISDHTGGSVAWDAETSTVTMSLADRYIKMTVNNSEALVNGETCQVTPAPRIMWGRVYVPVRFVAERMMGYKVAWDPTTLTISLVP